MTTLSAARSDAGGDRSRIVITSSLPKPDLLRELGADAAAGLTVAEVARLHAQWGPNAVTSHHARFLSVLWHQLRSPCSCC